MQVSTFIGNTTCTYIIVYIYPCYKRNYTFHNSSVHFFYVYFMAAVYICVKCGFCVVFKRRIKCIKERACKFNWNQ